MNYFLKIIKNLFIDFHFCDIDPSAAARHLPRWGRKNRFKRQFFPPFQGEHKGVPIAE